tara:strand:+ start:209 stop:583 length:375 start_codon:yes stop_codon:yes gene_type:complete
MAHFAQLDENNQVINVIVVADEVITNSEDEEVEQLGIDFCKATYGNDTNWVQTSITDSMRKQFAAIGGIYDSTKDKFIHPQPQPSWSLDENDDWVAPITKPDGPGWVWDEDAYQADNSQGWVEL